MSLRSSSYLHFVPFEDQFIVFSKRFGSISIVEHTIHDALVRSEFSNIDEAQVKQLIEHGFVITKDEDELKSIENLYFDNLNNIQYLRIILEITQSCNLTCTYCYQNSYRTNSVVSASDIDKLYCYISNILSSPTYNYNTLNFNIIGGEPLLYSGLVVSTISRMKSLASSLNISFSCGINTNGVYLSPEIVRTFDKIAIAITPKLDHDQYRPSRSRSSSFDKIISNIISCLDEINLKQAFYIRYNVNAENCMMLNDFDDYLENTGLRNFYISPFNTINYRYNAQLPRLEKNDFKKLYISYLVHRLEHNRPIREFPTPSFTPCSAYVPNNLKMTASGELALCDAFTVPIANISDIATRTNQWASIFPTIPMFNPFSDDECRKCKDIGLCGGKLFCRESPDSNDIEMCDYLPYDLDEYLKMFVAYYPSKPDLFRLSNFEIPSQA